jgi:hypothetical protein
LTIECPPESLEWLEFLTVHTSEHDRLAFIYSKFNFRIAALCSRIKHNLSSPVTDSQLAHFKNILADTDDLQRDTRDWTTLKPHHLDSNFSPYIINVFRSSLIKLQQLLLLLIDRYKNTDHLLLNLDSRRQHCLDTVYECSQQVLDSVPIILGYETSHEIKEPPRWVDGLRLLWPLIVVSWVLQGSLQHRQEA